MATRRTRSRLKLPIVLAAVTSCLVLGPAAAELPIQARIVLQKGRHYLPVDLFLHRGDTVVIRNGDEAAVHRAFIEADRFSFDAGDQEPGTEARLTLAQSGDFVIRCGIHPKMKLTIHVQ